MSCVFLLVLKRRTWSDWTGWLASVGPYQFHKLMSREIIRDHGVIMLLGGMRAEERLAAFLLNLSQRYAARGYSATEFNLRMTRAEIGHYLGMKLETVSRTLTKFQEQELVVVNNKNIKLNDPVRLRQIINREECKR